MKPKLPKLSFVFGTRPEAIKLAPVILAARKIEGLQLEVCVTGQHRQMLDPILDFFEIKPEYDFNIMQPDQSLTAITTTVIEKVSGYLNYSKPDYVIVQGDTTTVLATGIAAFYNNVKIAHVEAGLRTWNLKSPYPEEMNRVLVSKIAQIHFTPTELGKENLVKENVHNNIIVTGNTVIDALLLATQKLKAGTNRIKSLCDGFFDDNKKIVLITGHRRENLGAAFESICKAILELSIQNPEVKFVYPVHLNPKVQEPVVRYLGNQSNIFLIAPLDYPDFVYLMTRSYLILSDSGGVQEEAPSLGKPVLVMRNNTERPEGIEAGVVMLVGTDREKITSSVQMLLGNTEVYNRMASSKNPYGDGTASEKILKFLINYFNENSCN